MGVHGMRDFSLIETPQGTGDVALQLLTDPDPAAADGVQRYLLRYHYATFCDLTSLPFATISDPKRAARV